jgi:hypothetical protein
LDDQFNQKVDVNKFNLEIKDKVDASEIPKIHHLVENLNTRMKQLSILQSEMARSLVPVMASSSLKGGENINTKMIRRDYIAKQAKITTDWILDTPLD